MESNIFTTLVYSLAGFSAVLSVIVLLIPHVHRFDNILVFSKKVGPKYWGQYEGVRVPQEVGTIEVADPFYTDKETFGSRAYSNGSTGV